MDPVKDLDQTTVEYFLSIAKDFKLGILLTEQQSPKTEGLAELAKSDLAKAIQILQDLDIHTIQILKSKISELEPLAK